LDGEDNYVFTTMKALQQVKRGYTYGLTDSLDL